MLLPLFAVTMFISAGLLFWIQPLFAKMALPYLGGAPTVWNTAMMFFQATLLLGYGYAHVVGSRLRPRWQAVTHVTVIAIAFTSLPVAVRGSYTPGSDPVLGLVVLLALSIGLPFFAVSATAPLLQRWFALSGHQHATDPYFLYGASNLGSILALLAFPFVLEPSLRLSEQGVAWTGGLACLLLLIFLCAVQATRGAQKVSVLHSDTPSLFTENGRIWSKRMLWIALAFAPSSLLLGVTQHISTDIAAAPLFWVIPLALYLLTFVIAFSRRPVLPHKWVKRIHPYAVVVALIILQAKGGNVPLSVSMNLTVFFALALSCHGELVRHRPEVGRLTEFYLCMSFGGLLGGAFNVLAAPVLFNGTYEYGLAIMAAAALFPGIWRGRIRDYSLDAGLPLAIVLIGITIHHYGLYSNLGAYQLPVFLTVYGVIGVVVFGFQERPLRFALGVGAALLVYGITFPGGDILAQSRSFFGVYRVKLSKDGLAHQLQHGTTIHGSQLLDGDMALEPVSYYSRQGPLGQLFEVLRGRRPDLSVGLVGLGIGSALCYAGPRDRWTVFEIDPLVAKLARDERYFTLVRDCAKAAATKILFGDARLRLQEMPEAAFDLMILDAYSSDAIPIHLLTREALSLYRSKLTPGGVLMFHISNRHLKLDRVVGALVRDAGMAALIQRHKPDSTAPKHVTPSIWVAVAERPADLSALQASGKWKMLPNTELRPWTDDYSNIISVLR